jgi:hypothetical protein
MERFPLSLIILIVLLFTGCGKCGKNVNLGSFELKPQSIEDWYPYEGINNLNFKNEEGKIITLQILEQEVEMLHNVSREICRKSDFDAAVEYFWGEYLNTKYHGIYDEINFSISVSIQVAGIYYNDGNTDLRLKDFATYSFNMYNDSKWLFGGVYINTVDYRGNPIPNVNGDSDIHEFLNTVDINGNTYNDVWYFYREGAPSFYIQQGQGIIAFQGLNNEVWVSE